MRALAWRDGRVERIEDDAVRATAAAGANGGFIWLHFAPDGGNETGLNGLPTTLPPTVERALTGTETRPRCDPVGNGVLVNLRAPKAEEDRGDGDPLVSLRIWAERGLLISVAYRGSTILAPVEERFARGELSDPGDVIIALASTAAEQLDALVAGLGDQVDDIECVIDRTSGFAERRRVTALRTRAIGLRRFVVPQRLALDRLATLPLPWLDAAERDHVREAADRFARMAEELESVRERSAVLHEELTDLRAERIDARSLQIAIVAMIFLPLTFITGLLGMNVAGIPHAQEPWAFWGVVALCGALAAVIGGWFAARRWSER